MHRFENARVTERRTPRVGAGSIDGLEKIAP
jgi:hypothetical protein